MMIKKNVFTVVLFLCFVSCRQENIKLTVEIIDSEINKVQVYKLESYLNKESIGIKQKAYLLDVKNNVNYYTNSMKGENKFLLVVNDSLFSDFGYFSINEKEDVEMNIKVNLNAVPKKNVSLIINGDRIVDESEFRRQEFEQFDLICRYYVVENKYTISDAKIKNCDSVSN